MKIVSEITLANFEAWSGGEDTLRHIIDEGGCDNLEAILEDYGRGSKLNPGGC